MPKLKLADLQKMEVATTVKGNRYREASEMFDSKTPEALALRIEARRNEALAKVLRKAVNLQMVIERKIVLSHVEINENNSK